jgi:glutathione S-transferase
MLTLYTNFNAVCGQKVVLLLNEKKLPFHYKNIDLRSGEQHSRKFLSINPKGQVPVLVDQENIIFESSTICLYIENVFPQSSYYPSATRQQNAIKHWMSYIDNEIHNACSILTWSIAIRPAMLEKNTKELNEHFNAIPDLKRRKRQQRAFDLGLTLPELKEAKSIHQNLLNRMEIALNNNKYLTSDYCSLADICVLPYIIRLEMLALQHLWQNMPHVGSWITLMKNRDAYSLSFDNHYPIGFIEQWQRYGIEAQNFI